LRGRKLDRYSAVLDVFLCHWECALGTVKCLTAFARRVGYRAATRVSRGYAMILRSSGTLLALCAVAALATASSVIVLAQQRSDAVAVLDQGWTTEQRLLFYYTPQGSALMPAAWLEALESAEPGVGRFMGPENMSRIGFFFDSAPDPRNPYGWPIGFTIDKDRDGIPQAAFTCSACHTGQVEYRDKVVRIDGSQANFDNQLFASALSRAVIATGSDPARRKRFIEKAVALGYPQDGIETKFDAMYQRMQSSAKSASDLAQKSTPQGRARADAFSGIANALLARQLGVPSNAKPSIAPINYPYLWDMWQFDYVQYNGSTRQPMGRDIGGVIGQPGAIQLTDPATGELYPEPRRWQSNIRSRNIYAIRTALDVLKPPPWPEGVLGNIDRPRAEQGRALFTENCAGCHGIKVIAGTNNPIEWNVPVIELTKIGTDPVHAVNIVRNTYDASKVGLSKTATVTEALSIVLPIKRQAYIDAGIPVAEWGQYDGFGRKDTLDITPCGYKARPLVGVWATGPFLHNGSVPTIYDLLSETRPSTFVFGSLEFDPVKLGFAQTEGTGTMRFDNQLPGNSNAGHWFTNEASRPGKIGRALTEQEKFAIIEYLKAATLADYPTEEGPQPPLAPCVANRDWAKDWPPTPTR